MKWIVELHDDFEPEFDGMVESVQDEIFALGELLKMFGPGLGRPHADTLQGSKHSNMKELRFCADNGAWRVAFAFDTERKAILLVAGDKSGGSEKRFYKRLIQKADMRFNKHLETLKSINKKGRR